MFTLQTLPEVLKFSEVAKFARISEAWVRELAISGQLPSISLGRRKAKRILKKDLIAFLESRKNK